VRILVSSSIVAPEIGGPATFLEGLLPELRERGHEVRVLAYGDDPPGDGPVGLTRVPRGFLPLRLARYASAFVASSAWADVVLVLSLAVPRPRWRRIPVVIRVPGDVAWERAISRGWIEPAETLEAFQTAGHGWRVEALRRWRSRAICRADGVIVPSRYVRDLVCGWGVDPRKVEVVANAVRREGGAASLSMLEARRRLGWEEGGSYVVAAARLTRWKGIDQVIDAVAKVDGLRLVVVGDGPVAADLARHASTSGATVTFAGPMSRGDLALRLKAADYLVVYSAYEGLSHTALEALALGTPVIASRRGGNPEVVRDGVNGLLVPSPDPDALADALRRGLAPEVRRRLSEGAVADPDAWDRMIEGTVAVLARAGARDRSRHGSREQPAMRLCYATTARLPTVQAHGLQIVENCAAFAAAGADLELVVADRRTARDGQTDGDPLTHYGVPAAFAIDRVRCFEPGWLVRLAPTTSFRLMAATFGCGLAGWLRRHAPDAVLYSRDPLPLIVVGLLRPSTRRVFEAHRLPVSRHGRVLFAACARRADLVVALTDRIAEDARAAGAPATLVARDGYRAERFAALPPRDRARDQLGLAQDAFLVGYVGQLRTLGMGKGVDLLIEAAARLGDPRVTVAVVGGPADQVAGLRSRWRDLGQADDRLITPGQVPPDGVPLWLAALDVATMPFPHTPHFARSASPMKMFEYLAAGLPIVASDLPALAEVLVDGETAVLTPPGDIPALAAAIRRLRDDPALRSRLAAGGREAAAAFTWRARAERILDAIGS
jgi:glycosyltransferase involved in cell wall biosynthesis